MNLLYFINFTELIEIPSVKSIVQSTVQLLSHVHNTIIIGHCMCNKLVTSMHPDNTKQNTIMLNCKSSPQCNYYEALHPFC